jgi:hypothetical protein
LPLFGGRTVTKFGKRCAGTPLEDDRALPHGDLARDSEIPPRLVLVAAAEREPALPSQAINFGQEETNIRLIDGGDRAIEVCTPFGRPAGGQ